MVLDVLDFLNSRNGCLGYFWIEFLVKPLFPTAEDCILTLGVMKREKRTCSQGVRLYTGMTWSPQWHDILNRSVLVWQTVEKLEELDRLYQSTHSHGHGQIAKGEKCLKASHTILLIIFGMFGCSIKRSTISQK